MTEDSLKVFFSYSHKDEILRDKLGNHLKILEYQRLISSWHDRKILPGEEWDHRISENLESADIILLLVSADFIASPYCWDVEIRRAMEKHESGESRVIPIILRRGDWTGAPFSKLQCLPQNAKPVTNWTDRDAAFENITQGIRNVAYELIARQKQKNLQQASESASGFSTPQLETALELDLNLSLPLTATEMLNGVQKRVVLEDGVILVNVPAGVSPGKRIRVRGKGKLSSLLNQRGDLYLNVLENRNSQYEYSDALNDLRSEKGIDYSRLRDLLRAGQWKEADKETYTALLRTVGKKPGSNLLDEDIERIPCPDICTINQLWVRHSKGRFGFSVQKRVLQEVNQDIQNFYKRVGWGTPGKQILYDKLTFSLEAPYGHLPHTKYHWSSLSSSHFGGSVVSGRNSYEVPEKLISRIAICELR